MAKILNGIDDDLKKWIEEQKIFFVGSAPLSQDGHVNISPKGGDSFRVLGESRVAYVDYTGSGIETASHLRENGRIVIMFCSFDGPPKIVRFHGIGKIVMVGEPEFDELVQLFPSHIGTRLIIEVNVNRIASSCGYSVPLYQFVGNRDVLDKWSIAKGVDGLRDYRIAKNSVSIDGLPGI
jgi:hypothetical protein